MAKFVLDGVEFSGEFSALPGFYMEENPDWFARSDSKSEVNERPQAQGAFGIGNDWQSALPLSLKAHWQGPSAAATVQAMLLVNAIGAGGRKVVGAFTDDLQTTTRLVSMRRVTPEDYRGRKVVRFTIDMIAADPLAYGAEVSVSTGVGGSGGGLVFPLGTNPDDYWDFGLDGSSGRVSITNAGTAAVWPSLAADGYLGGGFVATDVDSGDTVRFSRPIPEGSVVEINQRTGSASIDGQSPVSGFITQRDFFMIPPGATHQIQFAPIGDVAGDPQFTAKLKPAYH